MSYVVDGCTALAFRGKHTNSMTLEVANES
jgi:hypothetical protein